MLDRSHLRVNKASMIETVQQAKLHIKGLIGLVILLSSLLISPYPAYSIEDPVPEMWVKRLEESYSKVNDYTVVFHKQERVDGKLLSEEIVNLKFKKPLKVYMKWANPPYQGREVIYVEGWNSNQLRAHEGGWMGFVTLNLDPKGSRAMKGNRHSITTAGIGHLIEIFGRDIREGIKSKDLQFTEHSEETIYGRRAWKLEAAFSKDRAKKYYSYRLILHVEAATKLPIMIQVYDWDNQLIERYGYENLLTNVGLSDSDFDPKNPEYKF
jgi:outer membrane lipoprotein-sorting protein